MSGIQESENRSYNFESQLELGEILLNLGRSGEALIELKKAQELCDLGATENAVDSAEHKQNIERLESALSRASTFDTAAAKRSTMMWLLLSALLAVGAAAAILMLVFNRADLARAEIRITQVAVTVADSNRVLELSQLENTRTVKEIVNQSNQIGTVEADSTRMADIAFSRDNFIESEADRMEAQAALTEVAATVEALESALATATYIPPNEKLQQVIVTESSINLRFGPGRSYQVKRFLYQDDVLDLIAVNETGDWYNVRTERGLLGWVARSVVVPIAFEDVKVAATIPKPINTRTPTAEPIAPAETETATITPTVAPTETATPAPTETPTAIPVPTETLIPTETVSAEEESGDQ